MNLPPFKRPGAFLDDFEDEAGVSPAHLGCLLHCMRDVLRGHGVAQTVRYIVRPIGLVFNVDPRFRPWLSSFAEEELTRPEFENGLLATYHWVDDVDGLREAIDAMLGAGKPAIVFANRWIVPWQAHSPLAQSEGHASVVLAHDANGLHLVDRQPAGNTAHSRDVRVPAAELEPSLRYRMAVLDYRLAEPALTPAEQVRSVLRRSADNLAAAPPQPELTSRGLDALATLRLLFSEDACPRLDSPHLRLSMRWHLPACIYKYIVGSRQLLHGYLAADTSELSGKHLLLDALDASCMAWRGLARGFALASKQGPVGPTADLPGAIGLAEQTDVALVDALRIAGADHTK
jgi:hypothetical protein